MEGTVASESIENDLSFLLSEYLACFDLANTILLLVFLIYVITVTTYSETVTFNKLTMIPYYLMMGYAFLSAF